MDCMNDISKRDRARAQASLQRNKSVVERNDPQNCPAVIPAHLSRGKDEAVLTCYPPCRAQDGAVQAIADKEVFII